MSTINPLMDSEEVAALLRCSVRTVEDYARAGSLPAKKFGDCWIFSGTTLTQAVDRMLIEEAAERAKPAAPSAIKRQPVRKGPPSLAVLSQ